MSNDDARLMPASAVLPRGKMAGLAFVFLWFWALVARLPMQVALLALIVWCTGAASRGGQEHAEY